MNTPLTKDELTDLRNWAEGEFSDPRPTREMVRRVLGMLDAANTATGMAEDKAKDATDMSVQRHAYCEVLKSDLRDAKNETKEALSKVAEIRALRAERHP